MRIGPNTRIAVVAAPSYFLRRPLPKRPQDLIAHDCINLRLPTFGSLYAREFEKVKRQLKVRVEGQLVFNGTGMILNAALAGFGVAYLPEDGGAGACHRGNIDPSTRRVVSAFSEVPFLLPEPPPGHARLRHSSRSAALPTLLSCLSDEPR
jgi:DNA-binding transcriptional LysR family regulator